jgi:hypothetical protein
MNGCWGFWAVFARLAGAVMAMTLLAGPACAQQDPVTSTLERFSYEQAAKSASTGESGKLDADYHEYRMAQERHRILALVLLATTAVLAHLLLLWRIGGSDPSQVVVGTGFIYIVFGTIVLVTLSDNKDQLTASMGVIGAIAGYLFGRMGPAGTRHGDKDGA